MTKKQMADRILELERRVNNIDTWQLQAMTHGFPVPCSEVPAPLQEEPSPIISL